MLSAADLDKILDEGYGDAGYNDPIPELEAADTGKSPSTLPPSGGGRKTDATQSVPAPYSRPPVLGATVPPPDGVGVEEEGFQLQQCLDEAARERGYKSVEEYNKYLEQQKAPGKPADDEQEFEMPEQLAPGIKKAPAYMPPGAYPGDRTSFGKAYDKELREVEEGKERRVEPPKTEILPPSRSDCVESKFVKQSDTATFQRPVDGNIVTIRTAEGEQEKSAEVGGPELPWALDKTVRKMKVGDIMDVIGRGEHAFADNETLQPDAERCWRLELLGVAGGCKDKFKLNTDERVERANELRLRGNDMFKQKRYLRAMDYYERGSALMDVLEAEDMGVPGAPPNLKAQESNRRIWQCQKPLLLNWALILMKYGQWTEAERKCSEVLMDIDKLNVKALFRRGQCNIHLGKQEQARSDLSRAAELDTSIALEVQREMVKVEQMQKVVDEQDKGLARKVVQDLVEAGDTRSLAPPPMAAQSAPTPTDQLLQTLEAQDAASNNVDEDTYCRQREMIYNHFLSHQAPGVDE